MGSFVITTQDSRVQKLIKADKRLARVIYKIGDLEVHIYNNPFEFLVFEIVGQMLSNKVATVLIERLVKKCGGCIMPSSVNSLSTEELRTIGISNAKCEYIKNLVEAIERKIIDFEELSHLSNEIIIKRLTKIRGIGTWTAKMYLIFVLQREDVLPYEDGAFLQGVKWLYKNNNISSKEIVTKCKKWKPYSAIAARYIYRAVDSGLVKKEFHLYKEF